MFRTLLFLAALTLVGCNCGGGTETPVNPDELQTLLLGVEPIPEGTVDAGLPATTFTAWVGALDGRGGFAMPAPDAVTVWCGAEGACAPVDEGVVREGNARGIYAVLLDDSGSNDADPSRCTGCPTDPDAKRVEAIQVLVHRVFGRAPESRIALFDLGWNPNGGRAAARMIAGYSSYESDFAAGWKNLTAGYDTPVYDSIIDVVPTLVGERQAASLDGGAAVPARLLLVSDGADTSSTKTFAEALALAKANQVTIDTVGYGQRDGGSVVLAPAAYRELRRLAVETGGFCTVVSADELPALFARVGELYVAGYAERRFAMPAGASAVSGTVKLTADQPQPFTFEDIP